MISILTALWSNEALLKRSKPCMKHGKTSSCYTQIFHCHWSQLGNRGRPPRRNRIYQCALTDDILDIRWNSIREKEGHPFHLLHWCCSHEGCLPCPVHLKGNLTKWLLSGPQPYSNKALSISILHSLQNFYIPFLLHCWCSEQTLILLTALRQGQMWENKYWQVRLQGSYRGSCCLSVVPSCAGEIHSFVRNLQNMYSGVT